MKKLKVNQDLCIGCGACVSIDEKDFTFDNGLSKVVNETIEDDNELAYTACESCPTGAISIEGEGRCTCGDECTCGDVCECEEGCHCHCKD